MKLSIAVWAATGGLVAILWNLYLSGAGPAPPRAIWTLVDLTCPVALARNHALSFYFVLLANAATYTLAGTILETMRQRWRQARPISN